MNDIGHNIVNLLPNHWKQAQRNETEAKILIDIIH